MRERVTTIERGLAALEGGGPGTGEGFVVFDAGASTMPDRGDVAIEGLDAPVEFVGFVEDFTFAGGLQVGLPEPAGYGKFYSTRKSEPRSAKLGTVKWFNRAKGYAFIQSDEDGKEVFFHLSAIEPESLQGLAENQRVSIEVSPKGAARVTPVRRTE